jgi:hypothetical protein
MPYTPEQIDQILNAVNASGATQPAPRGSVTVLGMEPTPEVYPYDAYQQQRNENQKRRSAGMQYISQQMLSNLKSSDAINKALMGILNTDVPEIPEFEKTEVAKNIISEISPLMKTRDMAKIVYKEVNAAEKETDPNKKRERLQSMIPKLVQSSGTGGTDAMQIGEFFLNAPELADYQLWAQSLPGGPSSINNMMVYIADPKKTGFIARPDDYIQKIKGNYNSIAETRNERISELEAASSPEWFKRTSGLKRLDLFKSDIDAELGQQAQQQAATPAKPGVRRIRFEMDKSGKLMPIQD